MTTRQYKCPDGVYRNAEDNATTTIRKTETEEKFKNSDFMKGVGKWREKEDDE